MKNYTVKISLIVLASVGATAGILGFFKTRVNPPTELVFSNMHQQSLEESLQKFNASKGVAYNDSLYNTISDRIYLFSEENLINLNEKKADFLKLTDLYAPIFKDNCFTIFSSTGWGSSKFSTFRTRIAEINGLKRKVGSEALSARSELLLKEVTDMMNKYERARSLVNGCSFISVSEASRAIAQADDFLKDSYIRCSNLNGGLSDFKKTMEAKHYERLRTEVGSLASLYYRVNEGDYNERLQKVQRMINDYNNNKVGLYGSYARDITNLNNAATQNAKNAKNYYDANRQSIRYSYSLGRWTTMYSPQSGYVGFQSNTCNQNNTDAVMTFTIQGYSVFTCYVRSDGEREYDYLTISEPNSSYNIKWSGVNKGNSNSYFGAYTPVTYYNLDPGTSYTITVKYHKDSSNSSYTDRGYLLLPDKARSY